MDAALVVAVIGAVASIAAAVVSGNNARRLATLQSALDEKRDAAAARREYEYAARKRLYEVYEPIRFQLVDAVGQALRRISALSLGEADPHREDRLVTIYQLLAPAAPTRMIDRNLTLSDMRLERSVAVEYALLKEAYRLLGDAETVFDLDNSLTPAQVEDIHTAGLSPHQVDAAADALLSSAVTNPTNAEGSVQPVRLLTLTEVSSALAGTGDSRAALQVVDKLVKDFKPEDRQILWRALIGQCVLYGAFLSLVLDVADLKDAESLLETSCKHLDGAAGRGARLDKDWLLEEVPRARRVNTEAVRTALPAARRYCSVRVLPALRSAMGYRTADDQLSPPRPSLLSRIQARWRTRP